ncbi:MAG TPA: hypothetical protein VM759_03480, partial [Longimicrobium sp.]|nr:hypothetical protein [Longimicrobium sp.]
MSRIGGIVTLDGAPVDAALIQRMAAAMAAGGPDGVRTWTAGPAGLVHGLLRTGDVGEGGSQPFSLD